MLADGERSGQPADVAAIRATRVLVDGAAAGGLRVDAATFQAANALEQRQERFLFAMCFHTR
jgi:hypothetical protein